MFMQIVVGVLNVIYALPEGLAMLHHAGAVCLLLVALILYGRTARITEGMEYG
jgi:heme A synthase